MARDMHRFLNRGVLCLDFMGQLELKFEYIWGVFDEKRDNVVVAPGVSMEAQPSVFG